MIFDKLKKYRSKYGHGNTEWFYFDELEENEIYLLIEKEFNNDPGSKAAYNIALHDAFCKSLNISLGSFLGRIIPELPTSITVGIKDINETIEEINEYYSSGFRYIKIKLGD